MTSNDDNVDADPSAETAVGPPAADDTEIREPIASPKAVLAYSEALDDTPLSGPAGTQMIEKNDASIITPQDLPRVESPFATPPAATDIRLGGLMPASDLRAPTIGLALHGREAGMKGSLLGAYGGNGATESAGSGPSNNEDCAKATSDLAQAKADLTRTQESIDQITAQIAKVESNSSLTPAQKAELIDQLNEALSNIRSAQSGLESLISTLEAEVATYCSQ